MKIHQPVKNSLDIAIMDEDIQDCKVIQRESDIFVIPEGKEELFLFKKGKNYQKETKTQRNCIDFAAEGEI